MNTFWTNLTIDVLLVIYVLDCLFMGLVILMQRSKQEGLGAAFGGGLTESVWGAQTSQVLVKATVWATVIFFVLSLTLARLYSNSAALQVKNSTVQQELLKPMAPASTNAAPAPLPATNASSAAPAPAPIAPMTPTPSSAPAPSVPTKPANK